MWESIARYILKFRLVLLLILLSVTIFMGFHASRVKLSYDFNKTIPTDNPKYRAYQEFRQQFGEDGNLLVVGVVTDRLFEKDIFGDYQGLDNSLKKIAGVDDVLSVASAIDLVKNDSTEKPVAVSIFPGRNLTQARIDSGKAVFLGLPFYRGLLYNPDTRAWLMAVHVNTNVMNSAERIQVVNGITAEVDSFGKRNGLEMHYSGLPLIRTRMAVKVSRLTTRFLLVSIALDIIILLLFFRSFSTMLLSLTVVVIGVLFSLGTMDLLGYKITLLNALTPSLMIVIGIPNCIYFLNKYHTAYRETGDKQRALLNMIGRMGVVTLFCNITAAIGFGVFALTKSAILNEFGVVAGINIMLLFFISIILIPGVLSYLPPPKERHMKYLENRWLGAILKKLEIWTLHHRATTYIATGLVLALAIAGMFRLKSEGFILDDLPKNDPIYTDLKFFEHHFKGVMPLEIVIDTKRKKGLRINMLKTIDSVDQLSDFIAANPQMARPLSLVEFLKFMRQSYYGGDSANYGVPNSMDLPFMASYLGGGGREDTAARSISGEARSTEANERHYERGSLQASSQESGTNMQAGSSGLAKGMASGKGGASLTKLLRSFVDTNQQKLRISVNMADIGSKQLPVVLADLEKKTNELFDSSKYRVEFTGSSVTYLEGSSFIIKGLRDSIEWAFVLIAACMLFLFRSLRILLCSLIPNIIPLIITAGIMGWAGVRLKPSTVIIFSIALGIAIDITIRFLVNYKQEGGAGKGAASRELRAASDRADDGLSAAEQTVVETINKTGISILYTSLVLITGFVVFCFSDFGGIQALGWLTSLTLVIATVTNLVFLPTLLLTLTRKSK